MNITQILEDHKQWLIDNSKGKKADLRGANIRGANIREADLSGADLSGADLSGADLRWTDLSGAKLPHKFISVSQIGSRKGTTTYSFENDMVWCGCFSGTLKQFIAKVKESYPDKSHIHRIEYDSFISMINKIKKTEMTLEEG